MKSRISENVSYEDFKNIYKVFGEKPYEEKYTEEDFREIYEEYLEKGKIYGAYVDDKLVGIIAITYGAKKGQPVNYEGKDVVYLSDVAVDSSYRKQGLGTKLMAYVVAEGKLEGKNVIYMRTLKEGSMSASIAKKIGFTQIEGAYQEVETESIYGTKQVKNNMFLELDLDSLTKEKLNEMLLMSRVAADPEMADTQKQAKEEKIYELG